jgi:hypothetical protein
LGDRVPVQASEMGPHAPGLCVLHSVGGVVCVLHGSGRVAHQEVALRQTDAVQGVAAARLHTPPGEGLSDLLRRLLGMLPRIAARQIQQTSRP